MLLDLFKAHSRDGRVILPLLKSVDILLTHQCLEDLVLNDTNGFKSSLVVGIGREAKNCNDVHRHFACIDVAIGLVRSTSIEQNVSRLCLHLHSRKPSRSMDS